MLEYSRIPRIPLSEFPWWNSGIFQNPRIPEFLLRNLGIPEFWNSGIFQNSIIPIPEFQAFWNIPEFLEFLGRDSWGGILEFGSIPEFQNSYSRIPEILEYSRIPRIPRIPRSEFPGRNSGIFPNPKFQNP